MVEAKPQIKLATVKPEAEIANSKRVPNARDRNPDKRDRDHFGDQIGGLHPRHFAGAGRQAGLDLLQRRRDDLDVQDRHEHPEHHDEKREQPSRRDALVGRGVHHRRRCGGGVGHDQLGTGAGLSPGGFKENYFG